MTVSDKEAKEFNKMLDNLKKEADKEADYNGGGAYKAFLMSSRSFFSSSFDIITNPIERFFFSHLLCQLQ